jgi:hypothetical protein
MGEFQEDVLLPGLAMGCLSGNYSVTFLQMLQSAKLARITDYEL